VAKGGQGNLAEGGRKPSTALGDLVMQGYLPRSQWAMPRGSFTDFWIPRCTRQSHEAPTLYAACLACPVSLMSPKHSACHCSLGYAHTYGTYGTYIWSCIGM
jgi:hypothetical protein